MNQLYYECDEPIIDSGDEEAFVFNNKVLEELIRNIYLKEVDVVNDIALAPWHEFWRSFNEATDKGIRLAGFNEDDRGFTGSFATTTVSLPPFAPTVCRTTLPVSSWMKRES